LLKVSGKGTYDESNRHYPTADLLKPVSLLH